MTVVKSDAARPAGTLFGRYDLAGVYDEGSMASATAVRSELGVAVRIGPVNQSALDDVPPFTPWMSREVGTPAREAETSAQQTQQQQQQ